MERVTGNTIALCRTSSAYNVQALYPTTSGMPGVADRSYRTGNIAVAFRPALRDPLPNFFYPMRESVLNCRLYQWRKN